MRTPLCVLYCNAVPLPRNRGGVSQKFTEFTCGGHRGSVQQEACAHSGVAVRERWGGASTVERKTRREASKTVERWCGNVCGGARRSGVGTGCRVQQKEEDALFLAEQTVLEESPCGFRRGFRIGNCTIYTCCMFMLEMHCGIYTCCMFMLQKWAFIPIACG